VDAVAILAPNPGPMTLEGTNTYVVGRDPAYVIDPGPAEPAHLEAIRAAAAPRGGIGGVLLTHSHFDHSAAAEALGAPVLWGQVAEGHEGSWRAPTPAPPEAPERIGPFRLVPTPGHSADHVCFAIGGVCFCGDLILGRGSSIVPPRALGGSLADYMRSLDAVEGLAPRLLAPGHGPLVGDPAAKVAEYREHRLGRERALLAALAAGERSWARLLEIAWADVPGPLRPAAALALEAHLEKLAAEGRLPAGVTG